jgi:hypothetical protein
VATAPLSLLASLALLLPALVVVASGVLLRRP